MTQIHFKRTGTDRELELKVDVATLPAGAAQSMFSLISQSGFFELPENLGTAATLDEPQYVITVVYGQDNREHTVQVADAQVPESLRPLIDELMALADAQSA
jgi:hypothetical protein